MSWNYQFTATLDNASIVDAFSVQPSVYGILSSYDYEEHGFSFLPQETLVSNTIYTVTISTSLKSNGGTPLSVPYVITFRTEE